MFSLYNALWPSDARGRRSEGGLMKSGLRSGGTNCRRSTHSMARTAAASGAAAVAGRAGMSIGLGPAIGQLNDGNMCLVQCSQ